MATRWPEQGGVIPIDAGSVITRHDRPAEATKSISSWFTTETLTVDFGDDEGRPSKNFSMRREYIVQFLQNGWTIASVESSSEGGEWRKGTSTDNGYERFLSGTSYSASSSSGSSSSSSSTSWTPVNTATNTLEDGAPYWAAVQRIQMKRRRMQPENVLGDIIGTYVRQYNAGIANEDGRFNEVVQLYTVMLNRTETEANAIVDAAKKVDVQGIYDYLRRSAYYSWNEARSSASALKDAVNAGAETETRIKFENLISKTRSQMVGQGTYNGTVWPTVEAGLRRQMQEAIAAIKAEGQEKAAAAYNNVLKARGDVLTQLVEAQQAIVAAADKRQLTATELRNTVLKGMLDFIGSREDVYPQLQEISQTASQIGFSIGASGNAV